MGNAKYNNFYYEKDDKYHKKGEERQNVSIQISFEDLTDSKEDIFKYGLDTSLKYSSHIIRETIIDGDLYEIELQKLKNNKWYVIQIYWIEEYDEETGTPCKYTDMSLDELRNSSTRQLNLFSDFDYE